MAFSDGMTCGRSQMHTPFGQHGHRRVQRYLLRERWVPDLVGSTIGPLTHLPRRKHSRRPYHLGLGGPAPRGTSVVMESAPRASGPTSDIARGLLFRKICPPFLIFAYRARLLMVFLNMFVRYIRIRLYKCFDDGLGFPIGKCCL